MTNLAPPQNYTQYHVTGSPETKLDIPLVVSWWTHPEPAHPLVRGNADAARGFLRHLRMHQQAEHYLQDRDGERTVLELVGNELRWLHHPVARELGPFPVPSPVPDDFGNAVVAGGGMGMYVFVAPPLQGPPSLAQLAAMEPGDVGMARFEVRSDAAAAELFGEHPNDRVARMIAAEPDAALRSALRFLYGLSPDGGRGWPEV
ncbi:hypothetical protein ABZX88_34345 [Kitasatospora aureofaciens]|uniref:hypothetical protein n=1 Tax=Kitasatospora aureofaciens TaxID=1894 RepID=UPI0033B71250